MEGARRVGYCPGDDVLDPVLVAVVVDEMSLACSCDFDGDDSPWYWWGPDGYTTYTKLRGQRCCSEGCNHLHRYGDTVAEVTRSRCATEWEELREIGSADPDSITMSSVYLCERCADLYFSLFELGFECVSPYESMLELVSQYAENVKYATYTEIL